MFKAITNFYSNSFKGNEKAWKVFFFGYLLLLFPYSVLVGFFLQFNADALYFLLIARLIYNYWLIVSLWKCSINTSNKFFNFLTKLVAVVVIIDSFTGALTLLK